MLRMYIQHPGEPSVDRWLGIIRQPGASGGQAQGYPSVLTPHIEDRCSEPRGPRQARLDPHERHQRGIQDPERWPESEIDGLRPFACEDRPSRDEEWHETHAPVAQGLGGDALSRELFLETLGRIDGPRLGHRRS